MTKRTKREERTRERITSVPWSYSWSVPGLEYIKVSDEVVAKTKELRKGLLLDVDKNGNPVGIEILSAPPKKHK